MPCNHLLFLLIYFFPFPLIQSVTNTFFEYHHILSTFVKKETTMNNIKEHLLNLPDELLQNTWSDKIEFMYQQQRETWNMARNHYRQFESIERREIMFGNFKFILQHNPARARSTCADLSKTVIENRRCFLCASNLPGDQKGFKILDKYLMLVNPFPIFNQHLTISDFNHIPQRIKNRIIDLLEITRLLPTFTLFYNGPLCGASAPDHFHFQAAQKGVMPIDFEVDQLTPNQKKIIVDKEDFIAYTIPGFLRNCIVMESDWKEPIDYFFAQLTKKLPFNEEAVEPLLNLIASCNEGHFRLIIFPRKAQRPSCYYRESADRILVSPASVELGGIVVTPREEDFQRITLKDLEEIFGEVSLDYKFTVIAP